MEKMFKVRFKKTGEYWMGSKWSDTHSGGKGYPKIAHAKNALHSAVLYSHKRLQYDDLEVVEFDIVEVDTHSVEKK
jgi:hypothetical protein